MSSWSQRSTWPTPAAGTVATAPGALPSLRRKTTHAIVYSVLFFPSFRRRFFSF
jgi:hypothetical protein